MSFEDFVGKPIILKCQSTVHNPEHLYLDGIPTVGGVCLSPATAGVYTGTHWMPESAFGTHWSFGTHWYTLRCLSKTFDHEYEYLMGKRNSWVGLGSGSRGNRFKYWKIEKHSETGDVTLQCCETPYKNPNTFLDGLTAGGGLRLSSSTNEHHCGTRWKLGILRELSSVDVRRIITQHFPNLNIHCFKVHGYYIYKKVEYGTLRHIWEQSDKSFSKYCSGNDIACGFKMTVFDWFYANDDQNWLGNDPPFCGIMWGTVSDKDIQAVNFTINVFDEMVLFDPSTGESISPNDWKPTLCMY